MKKRKLQHRSIVVRAFALTAWFVISAMLLADIREPTEGHTPGETAPQAADREPVGDAAGPPVAGAIR